MRVGINLLWLVPGVVGGSEEYTTRLLRAVHDLDPDDLDLTLFVLDSFRDAHPDLVDRFETLTVPIDGHRRPERVAAEMTWLGLEAQRQRIDLFHHCGGVIPPGPVIGRIPSVLTIHDLQPLLLPENFSAVKRRWLTTMLPRSARRARLIVTPSDPASQNVVDLLGVAPERVATVPHGVQPPVPADEDALADIRTRYRLDDRTVLYPAITYPHKDHETLIRAFATLIGSRPDLTLVLAGGPGPSEAEIAGLIRATGCGPAVRRTGRVPWSDLHGLYQLATLVAFPSSFEGFGAPALEAMAAGTPLVAADATALPWVVGDGGVLVAPGDVDAWAEALARVLDDPDEQHRLAEAGRQRARTFGWERAGRALVDAYRRAADLQEEP